MLAPKAAREICLSYGFPSLYTSTASPSPVPAKEGAEAEPLLLPICNAQLTVTAPIPSPVGLNTAVLAPPLSVLMYTLSASR